MKTFTDVIEFKKLVNSGKPILILYHATWCPHCIHFMNDWNKIAVALAKDKIYTLKIEHNDLQKLPSRHRAIVGFPTIVLIYNKKRIEYNGIRKPKDIIQFVKDKIV